MKKITAFAPASVANVGCGFDIMGFALSGIGDNVTVSINPANEGNVLINTGLYGSLIPSEMDRNTAGVAIKAYLDSIGQSLLKLNIEVEKNLPLGSGMGSSASSAAAALVAVNRLLGEPLSTEQLIPFAMEGERAACGTAHADNVAPSLLGGFVLIRSNNPPDIVRIKCPVDLYCAVLHPHIQIKTSDSRRILKHEFRLSDVTRQTANVASFMTGILTGDFNLIGRSMNDLIAEPKRIQLIPGFEKAKSDALESGAIGCGISGSGPSVFALCNSRYSAEHIAEVMKISFESAGLESDTHITTLNEPGAYILNA